MGTLGIVFLSTIAASTPFISGMARSMITRSGRSSLAFLIASAPSEASPQTRNFASASTAERITARSK